MATAQPVFSAGGQNLGTIVTNPGGGVPPVPQALGQPSSPTIVVAGQPVAQPPIQVIHTTAPAATPEGQQTGAPPGFQRPAKAYAPGQNPLKQFPPGQQKPSKRPSSTFSRPSKAYAPGQNPTKQGASGKQGPLAGRDNVTNIKKGPSLKYNPQYSGKFSLININKGEKKTKPVGDRGRKKNALGKSRSRSRSRSRSSSKGKKPQVGRRHNRSPTKPKQKKNKASIDAVGDNIFDIWRWRARRRRRRMRHRYYPGGHPPPPPPPPPPRYAPAYGYRDDRPYWLEASIGTQLTPDDATELIFDSIGKRYKKRRNKQSHRDAFMGALMDAEEEHGSIDTPVDTFALHKAITNARSSDILSFSLDHNGVKDYFGGRVIHRSSNLLEVILTPDSPTPVVMSPQSIVTLSSGPFSHTATISVDLSRPQSIIPIDLYESRYHSLYYKAGVPVFYALFTFVPDNGRAKLISLSVFMLLSPNKVPASSLPAHGYPHIQSRMVFDNTKSVSIGNPINNPDVHAAIVSALAGTNVVFASSSDLGLPNLSNIVYWGEMTWSAVSYAVAAAVISTTRILSNIRDPKYLEDSLSKLPNGPAIVQKVKDLIATVSHKDSPDVPVQEFPTLTQLLMHTSGLPVGRFMSCAEAIELYKQATAMIKSGSAATPPAESSEAPAADVYEFEEKEFLNTLGDKMENAPDVTFGDWRNSTEVFLVAMYLRSIGAKSPEEYVASALPTSDIIDWVSSGSHYSILECAKSTREGLVKYVSELSAELSTENLNLSPLANLLSSPIASLDSDIINYAGWRSIPVSERGVKLYFTGTDTPGLQSVLVFLIPGIKFWGVAISDTKNPIVPSHEILATIRDAISPVIQSNLPPAVAPVVPYLANAKYAKSVADIPTDVMGAFPFDEIYVSPFTDSTLTYLPLLRLVPIEGVTNGATIVIKAPAGDVLAQFDIAYDKDTSKYHFVNQDETLGTEILVSPESVSIPNWNVFVASATLGPYITAYTDALKAVDNAIKKDLFGEHKKSVHVIAPISSSQLIVPSSSQETKRIGGWLGPALLGGLVGLGVGAAAVGLYRPWGYYPYPYYRYGYGYPYIMSSIDGPSADSIGYPIWNSPYCILNPYDPICYRPAIYGPPYYGPYPGWRRGWARPRWGRPHYRGWGGGRRHRR